MTRNLETLQSQIQIPKFLFGPLDEVRAASDVVARAAVQSGDWQSALSGVDFVSVDSLPGQIVVDAHPSQCGIRGEHIFLSPLLDSIYEARHGSTANRPMREQLYPKARNLVMKALDEGWFCLVMLGQGSWFNGTRAYEDEKRLVCFATVERLLRWWPVFSSLEHRFGWQSTVAKPQIHYGTGASQNWYNWGERAIVLCRDAGMSGPKAKAIISLPAAEAARQILAWIRDEGALGSGFDV